MKKSFNKKKSNQGFDLGNKIEWKNVSYDPPFNPNKLTKFYAIIETEGSDKLYHYEGIYRSEAHQYFIEQARIDHGKFKMMSVFK
jgi:hypothetical protein